MPQTGLSNCIKNTWSLWNVKRGEERFSENNKWKEDVQGVAAWRTIARFARIPSLHRLAVYGFVAAGWSFPRRVVKPFPPSCRLVSMKNFASALHAALRLWGGPSPCCCLLSWSPPLPSPCSRVAFPPRFALLDTTTNRSGLRQRECCCVKFC